jgi:hypothetical protein
MSLFHSSESNFDALQPELVVLGLNANQSSLEPGIVQ